MKFGVREIADVVLKAKDKVKIGNQTFERDEPVIFFDTAKTSSIEGAATTVYAQGGKGNSKLIAWEGERTVTFTLEDALLSPIGFAILSGAGIIETGTLNEETGLDTRLKVHMNTQIFGVVTGGTAQGEENTPSMVRIDLSSKLPDNGTLYYDTRSQVYGYLLDATGAIRFKFDSVTYGEGTTTPPAEPVTMSSRSGDVTIVKFAIPSAVDKSDFKVGDQVTVLVDYYVAMNSGVSQLEITPDKFAGSYYLEASTLFRRQDTGTDMPATFVVPNVKIQSAFTFTMAATGDPSTFTFTMDAFPDYTKFDPTKKVLFALQIIDDYQDREVAEVLRARAKEREKLAASSGRPATNVYNKR